MKRSLEPSGILATTYQAVNATSPSATDAAHHRQHAFNTSLRYPLRIAPRSSTAVFLRPMGFLVCSRGVGPTLRFDKQDVPTAIIGRPIPPRTPDTCEWRSLQCPHQSWQLSGVTRFVVPLQGEVCNARINHGNSKVRLHQRSPSSDLPGRGADKHHIIYYVCRSSPHRSRIGSQSNGI